MIDYSKANFAFPKGAAGATVRHDRRAALDTADKKAKAEVMARDGKLCRLCGRIATEVNEALVFKSRGGVASLQNSIAVCAEPRGQCHQLMQKHQVRVVGQHCSPPNPLVFEMRKPIAALIFGRKPLPPHVRILEGK